MTIEQHASELEKLKLGALRAKFHEIVGAETKSNNRPYLIKKILQAMQPRSTAATEERAAAPSSDERAERPSEPPQRAGRRRHDPRLPPPGTILEREYQGRTLRATVLEDGTIRFRGRVYASLSKAALEATGTIWNGYVFWNLAKRKAASGPARAT